MTIEPALLGGRACAHCGAPIPLTRRRTAKYCSKAHQDLGSALAWRRNNRDRANELAWLRDKKDPRVRMLSNAKTRARTGAFPCTITVEDIVIPERCPIFGTPLLAGSKRASDNSPSLDKIVPAFGYVPGNVVVISLRANRGKADHSVTELRSLADFYENLMSSGGWMLPRTGHSRKGTP